MPRHKKRRVSEVVARPTRTAFQLTPAGVLTAWFDSFHHLTKDQFFWTAAGLTLVIGVIQTAVENAAGRGLLRQVPPTTAPVVDDKNGGARG